MSETIDTCLDALSKIIKVSDMREIWKDACQEIIDEIKERMQIIE